VGLPDPTCAAPAAIAPVEDVAGDDRVYASSRTPAWQSEIGAGARHRAGRNAGATGAHDDGLDCPTAIGRESPRVKRLTLYSGKMILQFDP
jgi:hypothetical protein